jgi:hypothetical protein
MRLYAPVVVAAALAVAAPASGTIRKDGIAGVRLVMTPRQVWAVRGRPNRVVNRRQWRIGTCRSRTSTGAHDCESTF